MILTTQVLDLENDPLLVNGEPATYRSVLVEILLSATEGQAGSNKYELFCLATRIQAEYEIKFSASEGKVIRDQVGRVTVPLIVGRIWDALDADELADRAAKKKQE